MKNIKSLLIGSLLAIAIVGVATPSFAQDKGEKKEKTEEKGKGEGKKKGGSLPLSGKVKSIDKVNKTITVGNSTVAITSETKLNKDGKPATFDDVKEGEEVGISYKKDGEKLNATSVRIGAKGEGKKTEEKKKEETK